MLDEGKLASVACSLLMKVLWAARLARPDLLRAVNHLARKVSKWTSTRDSMMSRLMGYTQATLHLEESGGLVIRETIFSFISLPMPSLRATSIRSGLQVAFTP